MSDPTHVCVAVIMMPEHFDEYESEDETFIDFCEEKFEQYTYCNDFIIGYELASTWNGVILLNEPLLKEIESMKKELKILFPNFTPQVIVRGFQV